MSKKFEKIVNSPHRAFKRAKDKLLDWEIKDENPKIKVEMGEKEATITVPVKQVKQGVKGVGIGLSGITQFLFWALKYGLLDNHLTRKLEKEFGKIKTTKKTSDGKSKKSKFKAFIKKNPNLAGHISYYLATSIMTLATIAGVDLSKEDSVIKETVKERTTDFKSWVSDLFEGDKEDNDTDIKKKQDVSWDEIQNNTQGILNSLIKDEEIVVTPGTYGEFKARMHKMVPMIVAEIIAMEGAVMKDGMHVVYDDRTMKPLKYGEKATGIATQGYGNTVRKDSIELDGYAPPITSEEALELVRWHLEDVETFFYMYCYDVACENISIDSKQEAMGIASMIYNGGVLVLENSSWEVNERFAELRKLYKQYGDALSDEDVKKAFEKYPIKNPGYVGKAWFSGSSDKDVANGTGWYINVKKDGDGIRWRRWLEACIITGDVTVEDVLNIPVNYMSDFFDLVGRDRANWFVVKNQDKSSETRTVNINTVDRFKEWLQNPVAKDGVSSLAHKPKVRDVMPKDAVDECLNIRTQLDKPVKQYVKTKKQKILETETYVIGYEEEYADALNDVQNKSFRKAAKKYEKLIEKYPGNALLYNDLAMTYIELGEYENAIEQVHVVLFDIGDVAQYSAAWYNAGQAYEHMKNYKKAKENYELSVKNGNKNAQSSLDRVTKELEKNKNSDKTKVAFNNAKMRVKHADDNLQENLDIISNVVNQKGIV